MKRRDLTDEQRYCAFIHFKIVTYSIILRNPTQFLPVVRIPRIYNQEPGIFFDVDTDLTDLSESELFYKILLQDHRV